MVWVVLTNNCEGEILRARIAPASVFRDLDWNRAQDVAYI